MKIRKTNGTLSMGQKSNFPAMALGLSLAMAAPALADWDVENRTETIVDGQTLNITEALISPGDTEFQTDFENGKIIVQDGGILNLVSEIDKFHKVDTVQHHPPLPGDRKNRGPIFFFVVILNLYLIKQTDFEVLNYVQIFKLCPDI